MQLIFFTSTFNFSNNIGTAIPPEELIPSTTPLKLQCFIAETFIIGRFKISVIWLLMESLNLKIEPNLSWGEYLNKLFFLIFNISSLSFTLINSPLEFNSFNAFQFSGLWLAVIIIPPCDFFLKISISRDGVVVKPISNTFIPIPIKVFITSSCIIGPDFLASLPTINEQLKSYLDCIKNAKDDVNNTTSIGVKFFAGSPPTVPLIPETDEINVICRIFSNILTYTRRICNKLNDMIIQLILKLN